MGEQVSAGQKNEVFLDKESETPNPDVAVAPIDSRARLVHLLLESSAIFGIVTGALFFLGYVYYQSYFGAFGTPLLFPPMGTSEYLTKAFDLASGSFVVILAVIWITTFVVILEYDEPLTKLQETSDHITQQNRQLGKLELEARSWYRLAQKRLQVLKERDYNAYLEVIKSDPEAERSRPTNWAYVWFRVFPFHITPLGVVSGLLMNLYLFLTITLVVVTVYRLGAMTTSGWVIAGGLMVMGLGSSILGKSLFHLARRSMAGSLSSRLYITFFTLVIVLYTAKFLAEGVGTYDARRFLDGNGAGSYLTILDTRTDRPDLEGRTFRVLIQRAGDYYLVPSEQSNLEGATLVVIPQSEVISQTTEAINP